MAKFSGGLNYGKNIPANSFVNPHKQEIINFSGLSVDSFYEHIQSNIDNNSPTFIWSKKRHNNKLVLDNEKQLLVLEHIRLLRRNVDEVNKLNADIFFSQDYFENLVAEQRMKTEHYFQLAIADHKRALTDIKTEILLSESLIEHDELSKDRKRIENSGLDADNELKLAQAKILNAEADSINTQNELKRLVMSKIDFNNFPPNLIADVLLSLNGLSAGLISELQFKEKYNDMFFNMEELKKRKAEAELNDFVNSAEFRAWKNRKSQEDGR